MTGAAGRTLAAAGGGPGPTRVPAIEVEHLSRRFGAIEAVRDVSFRVEQGEIFGLLGPNGAGKTTTIKVLLSLLKPSSGRVRILGIDVAEQPARARRYVGWVPQETAVDPLLTGRENLLLVAGMYHLPPADAARRAEELLQLVDLSDAADRVVRDYSGGMRKRLDLAMGLVHRPAVLVLDEPTLGLDIQTRRRLWQYIRTFRDRGTTILLTTHYLEEADWLCDRVAIIDGGRCLALDAPARLKARYGSEYLELRVAAGQPAEQVRQLARQLEVLEPVMEVEVDWPGSSSGLAVRIGLRVRDSLAALEPVLATCRAAGIALEGVAARPATLDDVFLHLTGRALRDGETAG